MNIDPLSFFIEMFQQQGISHFFIDQDRKNLDKIDGGLRQHLFLDFDPNVYFNPIFKQYRPQTLYQMKDDFQIYYLCVYLPESLAETWNAALLIVGPYRFSPISKLSFFEITQKLQIPESYHLDLLEYYNHIPIIAFNNWENFLLFFGKAIFGDETEFQLEFVQIPIEKDFGKVHYSSGNEPALAMSIITERYEIEEQLISAVQYGDTNKALELHGKFLNYKIAPRTADPIRNEKNLLFVLNTLFRKAVQKNFVHPYHIDVLSRRIAIQIEECTHLEELYRLPKEMIHRYCNLVKNYSLRNYSSLIQKAVNYIDFYYTKQISLKGLAEEFSVSPSYLSGLFRKEVGVTLTDYIHKVRIDHSLILLNTSALSIQEIAEQVGFLDVNYFTRTFKKYHGISPKKYRDSIQ